MALALALLLAPPAQAATITWTGTVSSSWHVPGNWNLNRVPMTGDDVLIPNVAATTTVTYTDPVGVTLNSLDCSEGLHLANGTLGVSTASFLRGPFTMVGGSLIGNGNVTISGTFLWTGGSMAGPGITTIPNDTFWSVEPGATPTLLRTLHNEGSGHLAGPLTITNPGVLRTGLGGFVSMADVTVGGTGIIEIQPGGSFDKAGFGTGQVNCTFTGNGTVSVTLGRFFVNGPWTNLTAGVLTGGTYEIEGIFQFDENPITTLAASIVFDGTSSQIIATGGQNGFLNVAQITAAGALTVENGRMLGLNGSLSTSGLVTVGAAPSRLSLDDDYEQNAGITRLEGGTISCNSGITIAGGRLEGVGTVMGGLSTGGTVAPGASPGILSVTGNYFESATAVLEIEIGGTTAGSGYDRLSVSGTASLKGRLEVVPINGFVFPDGTVYDVLTASPRSGTFTSDNLPNGIGTACVDVTYTPALVRLVKVPCPDTLFVDIDRPPGGNGQSWTTAFRDLTGALAAAAVPNVGPRDIWVAEGTYRPSPADRNASFAMRSGVAIYGGFVGSESQRSQRRPDEHVTILSGDLAGNDAPNFVNVGENSLHVVIGEGADSTAVLDGMTITGGNADLAGAGSTGGGVRVVNSGRPTLVDCTIAGNSAVGNGGGMMVLTNGSARLYGCTFLGNRGVTGGGLAVTGTTVAPVVDGCRFEDNRASISGGGASIGSSNLTMLRCEFRNNQAVAATSASGGALTLSGTGTQLTLTDCWFTGNSVSVTGTASGVPRGGAFAMTAGTTAMLVRCLFLANTYTAANGAVRGGAVGIVAAPATFQDCKFLGNSVNSGSDGDGGAVATLSTNGAATFINCAFSGNHASHDGGAVELNGTGASEIRLCSLSENSAGTAAGGVRIGSSGPLHLSNSILWRNAVGATRNEATQIAFTGSALPGSSLISNIIQGWTNTLGGSANLSADPKFANADGLDGSLGTLDDFLDLLPTSPAIDSGNNSEIPAGVARDLAGELRRRDDACATNSGSGTAPLVDRGAYEFQGTCVTGVPDVPSEPAGARVGLPAPNPAAGSASIALVLPAAGTVRITVLDVSGRRVRRLLEASLDAGEHRVTWDGADDGGRRAVGGLYFLRVETPTGTVSRKVILR